MICHCARVFEDPTACDSCKNKCEIHIPKFDLKKFRHYDKAEAEKDMQHWLWLTSAGVCGGEKAKRS